MARSDDLIKGIALGIGVAMLVPVAIATLAPVIRPMARQALKAGVLAYEKAREAVELIGGLMEKYGFLPSCGPESEGTGLTDGKETGVKEVLSVGPFGGRHGGTPGARAHCTSTMRASMPSKATV